MTRYQFSDPAFPPSLKDSLTGEEWVLKGHTEVALGKIIVALDKRIERLEQLVEHHGRELREAEEAIKEFLEKIDGLPDDLGN
jgi:hypothetical protein